MDSILYEIRKIPPVTRFVCASTVGVTLAAILGFIDPYKLVFIKELVIKKWEFGRLFTTFFLGGRGIEFIFNIAMLYRNSNELESQFSPRSADYAWQLILAGVALIGFNLPLRVQAHSRPLLVTLTYVCSRLAPPGALTSLLGLVTFPVIYFPFVLIGLDLIIAGPHAAASCTTGVIVGHLWWWGVFDTRVLESIGRAPRLLRALIGNETTPNVPRGIEVIPPAGRRQQPQPNSYNWGSGNRLGTQ